MWSPISNKVKLLLWYSIDWLTTMLYLCICTSVKSCKKSATKIQLKIIHKNVSKPNVKNVANNVDRAKFKGTMTKWHVQCYKCHLGHLHRGHHFQTDHDCCCKNLYRIPTSDKKINMRNQMFTKVLFITAHLVLERILAFTVRVKGENKSLKQFHFSGEKVNIFLDILV